MEVSIDMNDKELNKVSKTNGTKRKIKVLPILIAIILIAVISTGAYMLYKGYKVSKEIGFQISPGSILQPKPDPELKKDSTGQYTNALLIGIDTREKGNLMNTDTIMIVSYNHKTNDVVMISIPRDFNVQIEERRVWFNKINSVYAVHERRNKGSGLEALKHVVEDMTGIEIQYHAMIDFRGFIDLIDAVGGVYVNVENSFTDYKYPKNKGYETVKFVAGPQLMDGETALKYSRSRHSQQNYEGSDYARARRQQKVILAFKDILLSSETLLNPKKITDLMSTVQNNLKVSEFDLNDIQAGINIFKKFSDTQDHSYSFVLDPAAGNFAIITTDVYEIMPKEGLGKYTKIQEYVSLLLQNPKLYSTNPSINVYNIGLGYQNTYKQVQELRTQFKYLNIKYRGNLYSDKEGTYIFAKDESFNFAIDQLSKNITDIKKEKPEYITTNLKGEDISILFGKEVILETQQ
ncbi:MAG: LCP family protein [Candidatus Dojkabacteria bacterium]